MNNNSIEPLEDRCLKSFTVVEGYTGYYTITDDATQSWLNVAVVNNTLLINNVNYTISNPPASVSASLNGGNDVFDFTSDNGNVGCSVDAGPGADTVTLHTGGAIWGGSGNDTLRIENDYRGEVYGGSDNDIIYVVGNCPDFLVEGEYGTDYIDAQQSNDAGIMRGGPGNDTIHGSNYDDQIRGDEGNDVISGHGGNDVFFMNDGERDTVTGGAGIDIAYIDVGEESTIFGVEYTFYA